MLQTAILRSPYGSGPYGSMSIGETPVIPFAAALANAVADAVGIRVTSLPVTAERVFAGIHGSGEEGSAGIVIYLGHLADSGVRVAAAGLVAAGRGTVVGWPLQERPGSVAGLFHASVVSHKYGYEAARAFWLSARRDDEQWRVPREEEQRSRRPKGPADS